MRDLMTSQLQELAKSRHETQSTVIAEALKVGLSKLYTDCILEKYLRKRLSRQKAIAMAGLDAVRLAEEQQKFLRKDVAWGLSHG